MMTSLALMPWTPFFFKTAGTKAGKWKPTISEPFAPNKKSRHD
jgi:hypothetical protein